MLSYAFFDLSNLLPITAKEAFSGCLAFSQTTILNKVHKGASFQVAPPGLDTQTFYWFISRGAANRLLSALHGAVAYNAPKTEHPKLCQMFVFVNRNDTKLRDLASEPFFVKIVRQDRVLFDSDKTTLLSRAFLENIDVEMAGRTCLPIGESTGALFHVGNLISSLESWLYSAADDSAEENADISNADLHVQPEREISSDAMSSGALYSDVLSSGAKSSASMPSSDHSKHPEHPKYLQSQMASEAAQVQTAGHNQARPVIDFSSQVFMEGLQDALTSPPTAMTGLLKLFIADSKPDIEAHIIEIAARIEDKKEQLTSLDEEILEEQRRLARATANLQVFAHARERLANSVEREALHSRHSTLQEMLKFINN